MHARHASVLTHLCAHETFTPFDAHASRSPRSPRPARLSALTPCSSRRLPNFANALRRSRFRSLQPETAFRQLQATARRFGVHETCSSFDAHVRVRRWVPTSVNRRFDVSRRARLLGARARAFVFRRLRVRVHVRLAPSLVHSPRSRSCSPHDVHDRVHFM